MTSHMMTRLLDNLGASPTSATNMRRARSLSSATEKHSVWRVTDAAPRVGWISCRSELELAACEVSMDTGLVRAASGPRTAGSSSMA